MISAVLCTLLLAAGYLPLAAPFAWRVLRSLRSAPAPVLPRHLRTVSRSAPLAAEEVS